MKLQEFTSSEPLGEMETGERYYLATPLPSGLSFIDAQRLAHRLMTFAAQNEPELSAEEAELCREWDRTRGQLLYAFSIQSAITDVPEHLGTRDNPDDPPRPIPRPR